MELILVLPVILLLFFSCVQVAYFWIAKQLLQYAAYAAARTTLVTNVQDYANVDGNAISYFHTRGPLYKTAVMVMSWMESDEGNFFFPYYPKNDDANAKKASTWRRIRIEGQENAYAEGDPSQPSDSGSLCAEVTVHYYCPIWMPMIDEILAYSMAGGKQSSNDVFSPPPDYRAVFQTISILPEPSESVPPKAIYRDKAGTLLLHIHENCLMAKPYSTITYGRLPDN